MEKIMKLINDYFYNKCSQEEELEVQKWLAEQGDKNVDEAFQKIIAEIKVEDTARTQESFERFKQHVEAYKRSVAKERMRRNVRMLQRVAAILFLPVLCLLGVLYFNQEKQIEWNDLTIPHGMQQTLALSDGTVLHLNAGTRVIYPTEFIGDKREIFINGEMYADVAKNPEKPFIISAGDIHVEVLGTQFNFRAYNNLETVEVALVEGAVLFGTKDNRVERLTTGEMVQYNRSTQEMNKEQFLTHQYKSPSKKEGFYFSNLTLGDIVKELEYYFDEKIVLLDNELNETLYVAYFTNNETLEEILSDLNVNGRMTITRSRDMIFIDKRRP
jgi:ferric-dicitrate binding protein FerR (iron transport regulator)